MEDLGGAMGRTAWTHRCCLTFEALKRLELHEKWH